MTTIDLTTDKPFALVWGELHSALVSDVTGDATETGTCMVATCTLINAGTDEELGSRDLVVRDDDPSAMDTLNDSPAYEYIEDLLLTIHNLNRADVEITTSW